MDSDPLNAKAAPQVASGATPLDITNEPAQSQADIFSAELEKPVEQYNPMTENTTPPRHSPKLKFTLRKGINPDTCVAMGVIGLVMPPVSFLGIHDFVVGRWKYGLAHILILVATMVATIVLPDKATSAMASSMVAGGVLLFGMYESIMMIVMASRQGVANGGTNAGENGESLRTEAEQADRKKKNNQDQATAAFIIAAIHCLLWALAIMVAFSYGGNLSDNSGGGALLWIVGYYYIGIGLPLTVVSYALTFKTLKTDARKIATRSLIAHVVTVIEIIIFVASIGLR